jgi:tripartite-type tricarboxylate transporter receptor subunit TctC
MTVWQAVLAPRDTPLALRATIQAEISQALAAPALRARFAEFGADRVLGLGIPESEAYLAAEVTRWETILRAGDIP